jgi:hypothetical protein
MRVDRFEVLLLDQSTMHELKREWSKPELLKSIAWLKRMNARGHEVFIRPAGQHSLILVDALSAENLAAMRREGFEPSVVVECKPGMHQAWVALSARPVADRVRQLAAEALARGFRGVSPDSKAKDLGRLAGFTAYDAKRGQNLKRRFVLAQKGSSPIASNGEKLVLGIASTLRTLKLERDRKQMKAQQKGQDLGRSL